ncbi:MAG: hypothetical protein K9H49_19915 [Bacteroidales bacterium]|nr:hypothetical protein [Bacteroidales bacterium]MCF8392087.1 hypothetical protein [Bacteroidales bacterium]
MEKKIDIAFQIKGVELLEFELVPPKEALKPQTVFHYNISLEHKINKENKLAFVMVRVFIMLEDKKTILGKTGVRCIYSVANFDEIIIEEVNNKIIFPNEIIEILNNISISTTRGVMVANFKGTFLHNAILPVVDSKSLKKE